MVIFLAPPHGRGHGAGAGVGAGVGTGAGMGTSPGASLLEEAHCAVQPVEHEMALEGGEGTIKAEECVRG